MCRGVVLPAAWTLGQDPEEAGMRSEASAQRVPWWERGVRC